jgi:hypothetical protein
MQRLHLRLQRRAVDRGGTVVDEELAHPLR